MTEKDTKTRNFFKFSKQVLHCCLMHFLTLRRNFLAVQQFSLQNVLSVTLEVTAVMQYSSITAFSGALTHLTQDVCTLVTALIALLPSKRLVSSTINHSVDIRIAPRSSYIYHNMLMLLSKDELQEPRFLSLLAFKMALKHFPRTDGKLNTSAVVSTAVYHWQVSVILKLTALYPTNCIVG